MTDGWNAGAKRLVKYAKSPKTIIAAMTKARTITHQGRSDMLANTLTPEWPQDNHLPTFDSAQISRQFDRTTPSALYTLYILRICAPYICPKQKQSSVSRT